MNLYLQILVIQCIVCYVIDLSGAPENLCKPILRKIFNIKKETNIKLPLIGCSLCTGLWTNLIYVIIIGKFSLYTLGVICLISFLSMNISGLLRWIQELLIKFETILYKITDKIN